MQLGGNKYINAGPSAMAFGNAHLDTGECTCPERNTCMERNKKMQVRQPWHLGMLTWTQRYAPVWKEIKQCRSIGHGIRECSPGHDLDMDGCTCPERNKRMQ